MTSHGRNKNRDDEIKKTKRRPIIAPAIAVQLLKKNPRNQKRKKTEKKERKAKKKKDKRKRKKRKETKGRKKEERNGM